MDTLSDYDRHHMTLDALGILRLRPKSAYNQNTEEMAFHCPFHKDDTPSMFINLKKGLYNCFSCSQKGSIEGLYKSLTGGNLRKDLGYQTDRFISYARPTDVYTWKEEIENKTDSVYVNYDPTDFMPALANEECRKYIQERGISTKVATKLNFMYTEKTRINTTTFRDRLVIPIYEKGHLISMEGRRIHQSDEVKVLYPKNCSVNSLFDIDNLDRSKPLYVCEGLMDLCVLRSSGLFPNSTSIFGANLTARQASLLKEFQVIYIPDLDVAGGKTMMQLTRVEDADISYLLLPRKVNGQIIKDIGDIPKVGSSVKDLCDRKWLNYVKPISSFREDEFLRYIDKID